MRHWLAIPTVLALAACAPQGPGPEKTIQSLYAPYLSHVADHGEDQWDSAPVYSKSFKAAIDRGLTYSTLLNEPVIDYDPVADGQEFSIANLKLDVDQPPRDGKAHITAHFDNEKQATVVGYDMVFEDNAWKVDNIKDGDDDLRKLIDEALKPIGDPQAMKSPVAAIYARYGAAPVIEPLQTWALLTDDLRDGLAKASKKGPPLGFDPVRGGPGNVISDVNLEVASGGVIASFKTDGQDRVVVYDVVQDQGGWRIADIRGPSANPAWDLSLKLEDEVKTPD